MTSGKKERWFPYNSKREILCKERDSCFEIFLWHFFTKGIIDQCFEGQQINSVESTLLITHVKMPTNVGRF